MKTTGLKTLGLLLLAAGFLAGAFLTALDPYTVEWGWMLLALGMGAVGLLLHRREQHRESRAGHVLSGNIQVLEECLQRIGNGLVELCENLDELPTYEARFEIDHRFREDLDRFAEARESMMHVWGMQDYADVMSHFAAGERYINRVWSASTDGYVDEVREYLLRARDQFSEARDHFAAVRQRNAAAMAAPATSSG